MGIRVSDEHGVNPSIPLCFYCGDAKNEVVLLGRLPQDAEAPRHCLIDMEPCDTCKERRKTHINLIVVPSESCLDDIDDQRRRHEDVLSRRCHSFNREAPFIPDVPRSGYAFWVGREEVTGMVNEPELAQHILRAGWAFIPEEAADKLGLGKLKEVAEKNHPGATEIICRRADAVDDADADEAPDDES